MGVFTRLILGLAATTLAFPAPWTIQPTPDPGSTFNDFPGVSCPSATVCAAAGYDFRSPAWSELPAAWNGTAWRQQFLVKGDPLHSAKDSFLYGVSCPGATTCEMVGNYDLPGSHSFPLAVRWNSKLGSASISSQPVPAPFGATYTQLNGISCSSASACTAVGFYLDPSGSHSLAERWNGSVWNIQPDSILSRGMFNAVSCPTAAFCVAVGNEGEGQLAAIWNGSTWGDFLGGTWNGAFSNILKGVSCSSPDNCVAVGFTVNPGGSTGTFTLGLRETRGQWFLLNTTNPSTTENLLNAVSCTTAGCLAVGFFQDFRGQIDTLGETWNGTNWFFEVTPDPAGTVPDLEGVSCVSLAVCTAVGRYKNAAGDLVTLAERFVSAGSPHGFTLTSNGRVLALLRKPRTLELLVFALGRHGHLLGPVALGNHPKGLSVIRWNLRVAGHRLAAGTYLAELVAVFRGGVTSDGPAVTFDLTRAGVIRVRSATCPVAAAERGRC